jgi:uncharacterized protein
MKLQANLERGQFVIAGHGAGWVEINGRRHQRSLLVTATTLELSWGPDRFDDLAAEHLTALAGHGCDVLLLGTGRRQRFPSPLLLRSLVERGISLEVMDTAAACRTFNLLMAEGRAALAALIVE